jgi:hypothetical protein
MRNSAEVEAEVEASRNDLDRNVEALKQKMTPGQLFDEATRMMGGAGQQVAAKFAEQAKANPMPLAVMGLGLAWLMMSDHRSATEEARSFTSGTSNTGGLGESASDLKDGVDGLKERAQALGRTAQDIASGAGDRFAQASASALDAGRSAAESLSSAAASVRGKADGLERQARRTFADTLEREPLLLAGVGLLVGAAIGAVLPHTEAENRVMGEARDRLIEKGKDLAQAGMEKTGAAAQATYGAVQAELQGAEDRDTGDRLAEAVRSGVHAAEEQLHRPH